jgi:hypothetical protein
MFIAPFWSFFPGQLTAIVFLVGTRTPLLVGELLSQFVDVPPVIFTALTASDRTNDSVFF